MPLDYKVIESKVNREAASITVTGTLTGLKGVL